MQILGRVLRNDISVNPGFVSMTTPMLCLLVTISIKGPKLTHLSSIPFDCVHTCNQKLILIPFELQLYCFSSPPDSEELLKIKRKIHWVGCSKVDCLKVCHQIKILIHVRSLPGMFFSSFCLALFRLSVFS